MILLLSPCLFRLLLLFVTGGWGGGGGAINVKPHDEYNRHFERVKKTSKKTTNKNKTLRTNNTHTHTHTHTHIPSTHPPTHSTHPPTHTHTYTHTHTHLKVWQAICLVKHYSTTINYHAEGRETLLQLAVLGKPDQRFGGEEIPNSCSGWFVLEIRSKALTG